MFVGPSPRFAAVESLLFFWGLFFDKFPSEIFRARLIFVANLRKPTLFYTRMFSLDIFSKTFFYKWNDIYTCISRQ